MKSELKLVSPSLKITFTIGFFLTLLVIFVALVYKAEFSLILLAIGGTIALIGIGATVGKTIQIIYLLKGSKLELELKRQDLRLATYRADRAGLEAYVLNFNRNERLITMPGSPIQVIEALPDNKQLMIPANTQKLDLLNELDKAQRCLIVGASDSGKTTLLKHVVSRRLQNSKVVVLDPHSFPEKWPGCNVIGQGRDYLAIETALRALVKLMTDRYTEIGNGTVREGEHSKIVIVIDEWRSIVYQVKDAAKAIASLLTESRKAAFSVFVGSHSERIKALGLDGEGDLKDGFTVVRLQIVDGQRQATIDYGNGEIEATLPGPFNNVVIDSEIIDLEPELTEQEKLVLQLNEEGRSISAIAEEVFGSRGGIQNQQVKDILAKMCNV